MPGTANHKIVSTTRTAISRGDGGRCAPACRNAASKASTAATQNRQNAVKDVAPRIDLLLVVGSQNSSNSQRLTEVARARGVQAHLIDGPDSIDPSWLAGVKSVGLTSGASAPEDVVQAVAQRLRELGTEGWEEVQAPDEGVVFKMPSFIPLTSSGSPVA